MNNLTAIRLDHQDRKACQVPRVYSILLETKIDLNDASILNGIRLDFGSSWPPIIHLSRTIRRRLA